MKHKSEPKTLIGMQAFVGLVVFTVLPIACQDGGQRANIATPTPSNQTVNSATNRDIVATTPTPAVENAGEKNAKEPSIRITEVPSRGAGPEAVETIAGTVSGVKANECKVVVFARTNKWYVQPYIDSPYTSIAGDNTWRSDTHLGSEYAALLVRNAYNPPSSTGKLPDVGGLVLAITTVNAKQ
jgi:hypothetical protein